MYNDSDGSKYILENKFEVAYLFWIVLNNRRLVNEYVFLGVVSVDKSVSGFYVKPFDGAWDFGGDDFFGFLIFINGIDAALKWQKKPQNLELFLSLMCTHDEVYKFPFSIWTLGLTE